MPAALLPPLAAIDAVMLESRASSLAKRSIKSSAKLEGITLAIRCTDLTTLEGKDSEGRVRSLCAKAVTPRPLWPSV
ncbi:MAG: deoxyribose-phosphate aldolase, partial [Candidatus Eremiobacteraeota bacterium]|nr:deoxyribose-phosphate aldolase [Candidatus Eremiobacteraeota bacterium]